MLQMFSTIWFFGGKSRGPLASKICIRDSIMYLFFSSPKQTELCFNTITFICLPRNKDSSSAIAVLTDSLSANSIYANLKYKRKKEKETYNKETRDLGQIGERINSRHQLIKDN